ncbi:MAG TPA: peptidoglycan DD-metalloendopeptidase family protein [Pseudolabrys sp.]|nr:peptidoglycan DD-metalloendopeptidase family protein [Pseudolabrys sp.]
MKHLAVGRPSRNLISMICRKADYRCRSRPALMAGIGILFSLTFAATAQEAAPPVAQKDNSGKLDPLKQRSQQLQDIRDEQKKSANNEAAIKREIEKIGADRRKLNQSLIDTAARVRGVETKIAATEARLKPLDNNERAINRSLGARRAVTAEVLAALQRMGYRPAPALIVSPEDALQSVRSAMLLGAVVPKLRHEVEALMNDLTELVRVRKEITAQRDQLKTEVASLGDERKRLTALIDERRKQTAEREKALDTERARAGELARQASDLKDLIAKLESGPDVAKRSETETTRPALAALHDPGRMTPAASFASLKGHIPIPVNGVKIREFGAPDGSGGAEKGLSIATRAGAQVTAPADGWVVYAGPFRSYGQLLILNAGGGYHVLLAGMERISVDVGQFVLTGEPVAVMGSGSQIAAILATGSSQPVLYVEFRKDGIPVDPGPWWAASQGEKVRG